ncbi:hypothetical protein KUTeg_004293, partial [Tegillarca granosa]
MVKILSNGDVVPDDDPRAQSSSSRGSSSSRPRQGFVRHDDVGNQQGMYAQGQQVNVFDTFNQKLINMGIPRFNVGPYVVEPIVLVGFVLAGLLMGMPGLLFAAILFFVSKASFGGGFQRLLGGGQQTPQVGNRRGQGYGQQGGH